MQLVYPIKVVTNKLIWTLLVALASYLWYAYVKTGPVYESEKSLVGKTVLLTGGNAGIGKATAIEVACRGARVIMASRNVTKSKLVKEEIIKTTGNDGVDVMELDLENFGSVRTFANNIIDLQVKIDFLVNNAGAMFVNGLTKEGYNRVFAINHLGPFLLTNLLLDTLKKQSESGPIRIINLSSDAYKTGVIDFDNLHYDPNSFVQHWKVYSNSKLANIYFTSELDKLLQEYDNITTYAVHPGLIETDLGRLIPELYHKLFFFVPPLVMRSLFYGMQTTMYCMLDDEVVKYSGQYFANCAVNELYSFAKDPEVGRKLWDESLKMTGLD